MLKKKKKEKNIHYASQDLLQLRILCSFTRRKMHLMAFMAQGKFPS